MEKPIQILSNFTGDHVKLGSIIKITPFLDEVTRHRSCKGCALLPSINIFKDEKKVRLEGHYKTKKEREKEIRSALPKKGKKTMTERVADALQQLIESGKIPAAGCYAWNGQDRKGSKSIEKGAKNNPEKYIGITGLKYRIANRRWSTRIVRIGSIGEFARLPKEHTLEVVRTIKEAGLTVIAYTHQWGKNPHLKESFRASCDNKIALKAAINKGWKAQFAIHESKITQREIELLPGVIGTVCDFYSDKWIAGDKTEKNIPVTDCNNCRACKIEGDSPQVIIMPFHK